MLMQALLQPMFAAIPEVTKDVLNEETVTFILRTTY